MKVIKYKSKRYMWLKKRTGIVIDYGDNRQGYQFKKDAEQAMINFEKRTKVEHNKVYTVIGIDLEKFALCDNKGKIIIKGFDENKARDLEQWIRRNKNIKNN